MFIITNKTTKSMIITSSEFINSGLPTSSDISTSEIDFAIKTIELLIVCPRLTSTKYADIIANPSNYQTELNGSTTLAGLKFAEYNMVFAYLLLNKYRLTRYASVVKNDEHSTDPSHETLLAVARQYFETGIICLQDVIDYMSIDNSGIQFNSLIFNEFF